VTESTQKLAELLTKGIRQVEVRMVEAAERDLDATYSHDMKSVTLENDRQWRTDKAFSFDHHSMTMSVVASRGRGAGEQEQVHTGEGGGEEGAIAPVCEGESWVFVKGSFEAVAGRCRSAVADSWAEVVDGHSSKGCYVIAVACRRLTANEMSALASAHDKDERGCR
jgi:magnesium-transporting ATPase (P-type)